jgi:6-phosphogluconolactonase
MLRRTQHWIMMAAAILTAVSVAQPTYAEDPEAQQHTPTVEGNVFVMTGTATDPRGNEVAMFNRFRRGELQLVGFFPTDGISAGPAPTSTAFGFDLPANADAHGSQNSLIVSPDMGCLFVVNAASNTVTSFRVFPLLGLQLVSMVDSGGVFPVSLTLHNRVLYVLNSGFDGSINGYNVDADCSLSPNGSQRGLAAFNDAFASPEPNEVVTTPAQLSFTPDGRKLVLSVKGGPNDDPDLNFGGRIVVYDLTASGQILGDGVATQFSLGPNGISGRDGNGGPFSFVFSRSGHLIVTQVNSFTVSSYRIQDDNTVTPISGPLATGTDFPCWIVLHEDTAFIASFGTIAGVFNDNTLDGPGIITTLRIAPDGKLTLLDSHAAIYPDAVHGNHGLDIGIIMNDRDDERGPFLYATQSRTGRVAGWKINEDASLTLIGDFGQLAEGVDPNSPTINDFKVRCFNDDSAPECSRGSLQGLAGF